MTFTVGTIQGGTNAGVRRVKELPRWTCAVCKRETEKYSCCEGQRRP